MTKEHICYITDEEVGYDLVNKRKEYICPICYKKLKFDELTDKDIENIRKMFGNV